MNKNYKGFLIDLDGTAYLGNEVILETVNFVNRCKEKNKKILFVTNNASATQQQIYEKMIKMGYTIDINEIYTSALALADEIKDDQIFMIGDHGLKEALNNKKIKSYQNLNLEKDEEIIKNLKTVAVGYTKNLNYNDLEIASIILQQKNSNFYGTNKDLIIPNSKGKLPGNGTIIQLLETVTAQKATIVGKPSALIMKKALKKINLTKEEVCVIGDNYQTDILAGIANNIDTIYVNTGVDTFKTIQNHKEQPTYKVNNLTEFKLNN